MAGRETGFNKDITDAHRAFIQGWVSRVTPGKTADYIAAALFYFIVKMQRISDMVAYLGARQQGLRIHNGNIKKAIRHAGRAVIRAQASGQFQERTAIERGTITPRVRQTETVRIWSLFLSYFAAKMNVAWENTKKTNFKSPMSLLNWSTDMMLLFMVETAAALLVRGQWPDDDDDILPAIAAEGVAVFAQGIPIVREAVSEAKGFRGGGVVGAVAQATGDLSEQISQGEADKALARSIAKVAGIFF